MRLNLLLQLQMKKRRHCTILYATETGHSETYAKLLQKLFNHAFKCDVSTYTEEVQAKEMHEMLQSGCCILTRCIPDERGIRSFIYVRIRLTSVQGILNARILLQ